MKIVRDNCKNCSSSCEHAGKDREFVCVKGVSCKIVNPKPDLVAVVRCKDCKHCDPENYHCDHPMSTAIPLFRKPDDFCSYGERKEASE